MPSVLQERKIAQQILFPKGRTGVEAQPAQAAMSTFRDRVAAPAQASGSPETGTITNPPPHDTNTRSNINADTHVIDSNSKRSLIAGARGSTEGVRADADRATPDEKNVLERAEEWVNDTTRRVARDTLDVPVVVKRALQGKILPIARVYGEPKDAVHYLTSEKQAFLAPPSANWQAVYDDGKENGRDPVAALKAIGHYGTYDFQRDEKQNLFYDEYKHTANYAVGVYMRGAGFSLPMTKIIAGGFARSMSSNAGDPKQSTWWVNGWKDADSGNLPTKSE